MKRKLIIILTAWLCFLIQTSVMGRLDILAVKPNIVLILTVSIGFMQGRSEGLLVGFLCGIMIDLFYGDVFGFYALLYMLAGYFCGRFSQIYFDEDLRVPLILIAFCDLCMGTAIYVVRFLLRGRLDFRAYVGSVIVPEAVCTVIFSIALYKLFYRINHMLVEKEKKGRHSLWIRD